ncbi:HNH endonuclease family protein [Streptomyces syringium]|uniref:HNH endonuclease family protein n=1 Tax=Streptomyces syringium TaxID=76729 RepID=UPI0033E66B4A
MVADPWLRGLSELVAVTCAAGIALAGCGKPAEDKAPSSDRAESSSAPAAGGKGRGSDVLPGLPSAEQARKLLGKLTVAKWRPMTGYTRTAFPHWAQQGEKCDTRETVLARDGQGVKRDEQCRAVSGTWHSLYDDKTLTSASQADIDHIVPLANAWRSGADTWSVERRKQFANDLTHPQLLTSSAASNRSKGDQGPDQWQPPAKGAWCVYGRAWTSVKDTYSLTVTADEKKMLGTMLGTCTS